MHHKPALTCALAATLITTTAHAAERLILPPYPGAAKWTEVMNQSNGAQTMRELIPADQKIETYRDILVAQSFIGQTSTTPEDFLKGMFGRVTGSCSGVRVNGPVPQTEEGLKVAYGQIYCGRQNGKDFGVNMFFKVIQGADALYVINRDFRVPPSETGGMQSFPPGQAEAAIAAMKAQGAANDYLSDMVLVCPDKSTSARCKAP